MAGTMVKIGRKAREDFAGRSTGTDCGCYYSTKGHAINAFDAELQTYDLCLSRTAWMDYNGDSGRANHPVCDEFGHEVGCAIFSWHKIESGSYDWQGYLA